MNKRADSSTVLLSVSTCSLRTPTETPAAGVLPHNGDDHMLDLCCPVLQPLATCRYLSTLNKIKLNILFLSHANHIPVLKSYTCLVVTMVGRTDTEHLHHLIPGR